MNVKTYVPKRDDLDRKWVVLDAEGKVLGRVAAQAAAILRGKHKPTYTPSMACGDNVIVVNADKARVTGKKFTDKKYYHHTGAIGGIKETTYKEMLEKHPTRAMTLAIKGMLPKNRLGRSLMTNLRVYAGAEHPHTAQQPVSYPLG
jgi:large subunit ribosomal protein L13